MLTLRDFVDRTEVASEMLAELERDPEWAEYLDLLIETAGGDLDTTWEEARHRFGKRLDQMAESERIIRLGSGGDETMNAVEAYERGLALEAGDDDDTEAGAGLEQVQVAAEPGR